MAVNDILISIILIIASYLLGCINGAYLFSTNVKKEDIRTYGSGNAGATNVLRTYGFFSALIVFLIDFGKGIICMIFCRLTGQSEMLTMLCAFACVAGHNWPVFLDFRGGKGVATTGGILLVLDFRLAALAILIGFTMAMITRMVSVGSLTALTLSAVFFVVFRVNLYYAITALVLAVFSIYQHRANIARIINGTENKLTFGRKNS